MTEVDGAEVDGAISNANLKSLFNKDTVNLA